MLDEYTGAKAKARFKCQHGHEWEAVTESVRRGNGCPHCMGYHQTAESLNADIAQYGIKLIGPLGKMNGKALFECQHGHQWEGVPSFIKRGAAGCPFCAGRRQSKETINAELEGRGLRMIGDYKGQRTKTLFECDNGHQWEVVPMNIRRGTGCPHCTGRAGHSTETVNALLAPRGIKMLTPYRTGNPKATFLCPEGHEWEATIASVKGGNGCSVCVGYGQTLDDVNAQIAPRGFKLLTDFKTLREKGTFRCPEGHEWQASITYVKGGGGCPYCAGQAGHTRETFLEAIQGRNIELVGDYIDLSTNTQFQCEHGHIWSAKPQKIKMGGGCPHCFGLYQTQDSINADLEPRGIQIIGEFRNVSSVALFSAACGHQWRAKVFEVKTGGTGCPKCATGGIRAQNVAYVYVIDYGNGLVKVGSTGQVKKRLKQLRLYSPTYYSRFIRLIALYQFEDGSGLAAAEWEKRAHDELAPLNAGLTGFDGATELFTTSTAAACDLLWRLGGRAIELEEFDMA